MYALIGKSGAGKSTLLLLLAGLDVPNEGDVLFEGVSTKNIDRNKYRRESVSVIYQDFSLFPGLTVLENIMYPMELVHINGEKAKAEAKTLAAKVALPENLLDRFPREISGGEQQRVAVARGQFRFENRKGEEYLENIVLPENIRVTLFDQGYGRASAALNDMAMLVSFVCRICLGAGCAC